MLIPAILTHKTATPGKQLRFISELPYLKQLIDRLNKDLLKEKIQKFRYFLVTNDPSQVKSSLVTQPYPGNGEKVVFKNNFNLKIEAITIS